MRPSENKIYSVYCFASFVYWVRVLEIIINGLGEKKIFNCFLFMLSSLLCLCAGYWVGWVKKTIAISCYAFLFSFFCVRFVCLGSLTETPLGTLQWILGPRVECTNTFLFSLPIGVNIQMRKTTNTIILPQRTKEIIDSNQFTFLQFISQCMIREE